MQLRDIYTVKDPSIMVTTEDLQFLYDLLKHRDELSSINHREMPTWERHVAFVERRDYRYYWIIVVDGANVGAIYISQQEEIGVHVLPEHQGKGYGSQAIKMAMKWRPPGTKFLANINPRNERSIKMFEGLGFRHIQSTYRFA